MSQDHAALVDRLRTFASRLSDWWRVDDAALTTEAATAIQTLQADLAAEKARAEGMRERCAQVADDASRWTLDKDRLGGDRKTASRIVNGNIQRNQNAKWIAAAIRALGPDQ